MDIVRGLILAVAASGFALLSPRAGTAAPDGTLGMALMGADVDTDGTLLSGSGVVLAKSEAPSFPNIYLVEFDRDVKGCILSAAPFFSDFIASAQVNPDLVNTVVVVTQSPPGTKTPGRFSVIVFCPK